MEAQWERQAVEVLAGQRDLGLHAQLWKIVQKTPRDWIEARLRREIVRRSVEEEEGTRSEVFGQWMREVESGREDMEEVERQAKKGVQRFRIWRLAEMRSSADVVFHSETEEKEFRRKAQCAIFLAPESVETQVVAAMLGFQGKYRPFSHKKPPAVNLLRALETRIAEEASQVTRVLKILAYAIMAHASLRDESKSRDFIVKGLRALKEWECENDSRKERLAQYLQFVSCVSFRLNESESKLNKATRILSSIISQPSSEFIKYVSSLELGRCLILLGKYAEAEQEIGSFVKGEYRHLLDRDCQAYSFCIYSRAIVFLNRNLFSEAQILTMARKPVEMFPQDPEYHMNLGMIYYTLGGQYIAESRFAYAELMQAAKLDFSRLNSETYAFLGLYHKTIAGNENIALRCFQTGYQINPSCRIVVKSFAEFCVSLGLLENANTILLKYSNTVADAPWCWSTLAEIAQKRGSSELEIRYLQNAIKFQSCNPILWARLSDAYMRVGKLVAALKSIDSAISFDLSTNLYFAFKKASILSVLGEKRKSIEILQEIERISTEDVDSMLPLLELHARLLLEESTQLLHDGAVKSAEISCAMLSKLISRILNVRLCSPLSSIWRLCGDFHLIQNVLEPSTKSARISAQRYFSRLVFLDPSSGNAWYNLGVTINRLDLSIDADLKMSTQCSLAAIKSDPIQPHFWSLLGMNLASVKARASLHCLLQAIELSPSIGQNWSILGHFLLMRNDLSHASSILKIAQSVDPSNSLVWLGNALLSYSIDQIGSAKEHLSQTVGSSAMVSLIFFLMKY